MTNVSRRLDHDISSTAVILKIIYMDIYNFIYFEISLFYIYYALSAYRPACQKRAPHPIIDGYKPSYVWLLGTELRTSEEEPEILTAEPSFLKPHSQSFNTN